METVILNEQDLPRAAELLLSGELVAFPTETVYGLGADATNPKAVKRVYEAKGRPSDNPLIVHVASLEELSPFVKELPPEAKTLAEAFWPGPLTMIFEIVPGSLPMEVTGGLSTVAFRIPDHDLTLNLIKQAGVPLVGPSANTSGKPSPTSAAHVYHDLQGKIAAVLDGGSTRVGIESTVLDLSVPHPVILRPGKIVAADIKPLVVNFEEKENLPVENQPKAPGMKYQHYSPEVKVVMMPVGATNWSEAVAFYSDAQIPVGVLASQAIITELESLVCESYQLTVHDDVSEASQQLFAGLRYLDQIRPKLGVILVQSFPGEGLGLAYMNRLQKSADNCYFPEQ